MVGRVRKWGNSLGLRIPKPVAAEVELRPGSAVRLTVRDGTLVVKPLKSPAHDLADLLAAVTAENLHGEVDSGGAVGREIW